MYPEITWRANWSFDQSGVMCNNTAYFVSSSDLWVLAVANSPIGWWYAWRAAQHGKDEALRFFTVFVESLPIPGPNDNQRIQSQQSLSRVLQLTDDIKLLRDTLLDWLRVEHGLEKTSQKLQAFTELGSDDFVAEVRKARGKKSVLSAAALKSLRDEYASTIEPARTMATEAATLERQVSDLVNEAYGLTPDEVELMWKTAPPRMPLVRSESPGIGSS